MIPKPVVAKPGRLPHAHLFPGRLCCKNGSAGLLKELRADEQLKTVPIMHGRGDDPG